MRLYSGEKKVANHTSVLDECLAVVLVVGGPWRWASRTGEMLVGCGVSGSPSLL